MGASIAVFKGDTVLLVERGRAIADLEKPSLTGRERPCRARDKGFQRLAFAAKTRYSNSHENQGARAWLGSVRARCRDARLDAYCRSAILLVALLPGAAAKAPEGPRPSKPKPPADDLPPIVPKESSIPPPPDDRPYDAKLLRLAEILGAVHYLRELCGAQEGQLWRDQMKEIVKNEGSTAVRRAKLVNSFNDGYRGYRRTYRTCTSSATLAITRFSTEGAQIAAALAKPSHYASRGSTTDTPASTTATDAAPATGNAPAASGSATPSPEAKPADATKPAANQAEATPQGEAAATEANPVDGAEKPKKKKRKAANERSRRNPSQAFRSSPGSRLGDVREKPPRIRRLTVSSPFSPVGRASVPVFGLSTRIAKNRGIPRCSRPSV